MKSKQSIATGFLAELAVLSALVIFPSSPAQAVTLYMDTPEATVVGHMSYVEARHEDTLMDVARRNRLGFQEIRLANPGVDLWIPGEGTRIRIPLIFVLPDAPREGIVLNLAEKRLYYFPPGGIGGREAVVSYPIGIGRFGRRTPTGNTRVITKVANPTWYPPESLRVEYAERGEHLPRVVPPGPENPLGDHALQLALPGYLIHGTHQPDGVGLDVSAGCVRLYPEDIRVLFEEVPVGTPVTIIDQRYKAGYRRGRIFVEVHPPYDEEEDVGDSGLNELVQRVTEVSSAHAGALAGEVDQDLVVTAYQRADGVPVDVTRTRDHSVWSGSAR